MEIQTISPSAYAIHFDRGELSRLRIVPSSVTDGDLRLLLQRAFRQIQKPPDEHVSLRLYPGREELLLFLQLDGDGRMYIGFSDLETMLDALSVCSALPDAALYSYAGGYVLSFLDPLSSRQSALLSEYGRLFSGTEDYELHLAEHGRRLLAHDAAGVLTQAFLHVHAAPAL